MTLAGTAEHGATAPSVREMVEYVARNLVDNPEAVHVSQQERGNTIELRLMVDPDEMGKVIGRQGRVARALRALVAASATRAGKRVILEIG
jgi:predicted RNA-binding protein YlqC (UPF0109 family)